MSMDDFEYQQLQNRLNRVESSLTRLLNHLPGLAYRCSIKGNYEYRMIFVSQGCEKILEIPKEEALRVPTNLIESMTIEEDLSRMRNVIHGAIQAKQSYEVYYRIRLPCDKIKWVWDQGEGVYDKQGKCIFIEGIMMDVTAQKMTEQMLESENRQLRSSVPNFGGLGPVIGKSASMQNVYDLMLKAAKSDTNVILYGETGVGKDLVAKTIHDLSEVKGRYIPVNCAAIPDQLLESEFFGHVKGAFSGATANRAGYLAAADGGTLFLDEIAELPLNLQVKLLRALETRTYTPVGSNQSRTSNFRLISATNRDLKTMVEQKTMRADFFYRVHVLVIPVPALRERKGDIPLLVSTYAKTRGAKKAMPPQLMARLEAYSWPGNVRELQNTLDRYWVFGELGLDNLATTPPVPDRNDALTDFDLAPPTILFTETTTDNALPPFLATTTLSEPPSQPAYPSEIPAVLADARENSEKQQILNVLQQCGWKKGQTAAALGVTTRTLQRKLKKYNIGK